VTIRMLAVLHDLSERELTEQFVSAAAHVAADQEPLAILFFDHPARATTARIFTAGHVPFDVLPLSSRIEVGALPADRVLGSARRYASQRRFEQSGAAIAFARTHDLSPAQVELADALEAFAAKEAGCDHGARCCREHDTHSSPHVGCVLR